MSAHLSSVSRSLLLSLNIAFRAESAQCRLCLVNKHLLTMHAAVHACPQMLYACCQSTSVQTRAFYPRDEVGFADQQCSGSASDLQMLGLQKCFFCQGLCKILWLTGLSSSSEAHGGLQSLLATCTSTVRALLTQRQLVRTAGTIRSCVRK